MNRTDIQAYQKEKERFLLFGPIRYFKNKGNRDKFGSTQEVKEFNSGEKILEEKNSMWFQNRQNQIEKYGNILKAGSSLILMSAYGRVHCVGVFNIKKENLESLWSQLSEYYHYLCGHYHPALSEHTSVTNSVKEKQEQADRDGNREPLELREYPRR